VSTIRLVDVTDQATFGLIPPCADPSFDHRTCDYWEDADRGSKFARPAWLAARVPEPTPPRKPQTGNPFLDDLAEASGEQPGNPFLASDGPALDNPFASPPAARPSVGRDAPRKLELLARGLGIAGSYAKVLLVDDVVVAWSQFGPLSAYPRALRLRELYPQLPDAPLPAVITCIATTIGARRQGHALRLVEAVCTDLTERGFAAVEAYPERDMDENATSAAWPEFWARAGFGIAVDDERYPVVRREL